MKLLQVFTLSMLGFSSLASAETYNFYFEQNSPTPPKASPVPLMVINQQNPHPVHEVKATHFRASVTGFYGSRSQDLGSGGGFGLTGNYLFTDRIHLNAGLGVELGNRAFGLIEGEYALSHSSVEAGLLIGANTFQKVDGNSGSFHTGAKLNIRINRVIELTTAVRANLGFAMAETGLAVRL